MDSESKDKLTQNNSKGPLIAIIAVIVVIIIAVGAYAFNMLSNRLSPEERLAKALIEASESQMGEVASTIKINDLQLAMDDSDAAMIGEILGDLEVVTLLRYDVEGRRMEGAVDLEIMGTGLIGADLYLDREYLMLDIPLFYDRALYISFTDLVALIQSPMVDAMVASAFSTPDTSYTTMPVDGGIDADQIESTMDILYGLMERDTYDAYKAIDQEPYRTLLATYFAQVVGEITEEDEGLGYRMTYDDATTESLIENALVMMAEDEAVIGYLEEVINRFFDHIIEEKNWLLHDLLVAEGEVLSTGWEEGIYEADMELLRQDALASLDDRIIEARDSMQKTAEESSVSVGVDLADVEEAFDMVIEWRLDASDHLSGQEVVMDVDLTDWLMEESHVELQVTSEFKSLDGDDMAFQGIDFDNALDIGGLDEMALSELMMEIQTNVMYNVMNNPLFSDLFYLQ